MEIIIVLLVLCLVFVLVKHIAPERTKLQQQTDELITVIMPTIKHE